MLMLSGTAEQWAAGRCDIFRIATTGQQCANLVAHGQTANAFAYPRNTSADASGPQMLAVGGGGVTCQRVAAQSGRFTPAYATFDQQPAVGWLRHRPVCPAEHVSGRTRFGDFYARIVSCHCLRSLRNLRCRTIGTEFSRHTMRTDRRQADGVPRHTNRGAAQRLGHMFSVINCQHSKRMIIRRRPVGRPRRARTAPAMTFVGSHGCKADTRAMPVRRQRVFGCQSGAQRCGQPCHRPPRICGQFCRHCHQIGQRHRVIIRRVIVGAAMTSLVICAIPCSARRTATTPAAATVRP